MFWRKLFHTVTTFTKLNRLSLYPGHTISLPSAPFFEGRWFWASAGLRGEVISFPLAQTGEGIAECEVIRWIVKEGDRIKKFDKICEVQSDKASMEISSPHDGQIKFIPHEVGGIVKVGSTLVEIELDGEADQNQKMPQSSIPTSESRPKQEAILDKPLASPAVRLLAKEHQVDLKHVRGTGPGNRIQKEDVEQYIKKEQVTKDALHDVTLAGIRRKEIRGYRRIMLKSMTESLQIPHFHFSDDINLTEITRLRKQIEAEDNLNGLKITLLPIFIKALSLTLAEFPDVNSSLSGDQNELILHDDHNIGIAMNTDDGLVVPSIKSVQKKCISEIVKELDELRKAAYQKKLTSSEISGTTIGISNVGAIGGHYATPLIPPPQAAIVALGKVRSAIIPPVETGSQFYTFPSLPISWGADHRILDGATMVHCSNRLKALIEAPGKLLLNLK